MFDVLYRNMADPLDWTTIPTEEEQVVPHLPEPEDSPLHELPVPLSPLTSDEETYEEDDPSDQARDSNEPIDLETKPIEEETGVVTEAVDKEINPMEEEVGYSEWEDEDPEEEI